MSNTLDESITVLSSGLNKLNAFLSNGLDNLPVALYYK